MSYMEIEIADLQWDDFNIKHIARHGVSTSEVQEACHNCIYVDQTYADRYLLVGQTKQQRFLSIVLSKLTKIKYYVVTARDSSRGERKKANDQENH